MSSSPEEMIQNILSDPETMEKIGSLLSGISGERENESKNEGLPMLENPEMILKMGKILQKMSGEEDNNTRLIMALKPYLSERRAESADKAIKMLKLSKMTSLLGDVKLF